MIETLAIPIAFSILAAILLWILVDKTKKGQWWWKVPTIAVTFAFTFMVWFALDSYLGWPVKGLPDKFILVGIDVQESKDVIYVWAKRYGDFVKEDEEGTVLEYNPQIGSPRNYVEDYDEIFHERLQAAMEMVRRGNVIVFERGKGGASDQAGRGKRGKKGKGGGYRYKDKPDFLFYVLPPAKSPNKSPND